MPELRVVTRRRMRFYASLQPRTSATGTVALADVARIQANRKHANAIAQNTEVTNTALGDTAHSTVRKNATSAAADSSTHTAGTLHAKQKCKYVPRPSFAKRCRTLS